MAIVGAAVGLLMRSPFGSWTIKTLLVGALDMYYSFWHSGV